MNYYPWIAAMCRPLMVCIHFRALWRYMRIIWWTVTGTFATFCMITIFIIVYTWMLNRWFTGTPQGVSIFPSFPETLYQMWILMTTSNYPDVTMPSYISSNSNSFMFILYLVIVLFLLMNLLLAEIYSKFVHNIQILNEEKE